MVFAALAGGESHVTTGLTGYAVTDPLQRAGQISTRHVARELQAEITSSRAKCKRMTLGASP